MSEIIVINRGDSKILTFNILDYLEYKDSRENASIFFGITYPFEKFENAIIKGMQSKQILKLFMENLTTKINNEIFKIRNIDNSDKLSIENSKNNIEKLASKKSRLLNIETIKKFSYEPNGTNTSKDCLTHSEVISMSASFLLNKPLMQSIFISKYPILLIDESQDTNKYLLEAFFAIQQKYKKKIFVGIAWRYNAKNIF